VAAGDEEEPVAVKPRWLVVLFAALTLVTIAPGRGAAAPADPDGSQAGLQKELDQVARDYLATKAKLDGARQRQEALTRSITETSQRLTTLQTEVTGVAAAAYRGERLSLTLVVLNGQDASSLLHNAVTVDHLTRRENRDLHELAAAKRVYAQQRDSLANLTARLDQQVGELDQRKKKVETALARFGGAPSRSGVVAGGGVAQPAPRNGDGSWPAGRARSRIRPPPAA
jgi:prefoldin subunit 5